MTWNVGPTSLNLKTNLISLNKDLDTVLARIRFRSDNWFLYSDLDPNYDGQYAIEVAVLYLEDRRFYVHRGAEMRAVPRLLRRISAGKRVGGISTIEQQVVRTILGRRERTISRKIREITLAACLGYHVDKRKILGTYLADAYFGEEVIGARSASELVFKREPSQLNRQEACWLASLLPHPMPKVIIRQCEKFKGVMTVGEMQILASDVAPTWARKVSRRYSYVSRGVADFIPRRRWNK